MIKVNVFSGVRVTLALVVGVCFVDRCCSFYFRPLCCLSSNGFLLPLWYIQTLLLRLWLKFVFISRVLRYKNICLPDDKIATAEARQPCPTLRGC